MIKLLWLLAFVCLQQLLCAQRSKPFKDKNTDTSLQAQEQVYEMPVVTVNENERSDQGAPYVPSVLYSNRDVFLNMASFHFSALRFKMRGYDADLFSTQVNGMHMNNLDDGNTQWSLWSGLNDVTRNSQLVLALRAGEQSFGNVGNMVSTDMRASKQRVQTQYGYSFGNRSYTHRWTFTETKPMNKKGWAYAVSASWRMAKTGVVPGTDYQSAAYFAGIDKKLGGNHLLSLVLFGNHTTNAKQGPVLKECSAFLENDFHNPYWGYQNGRKRNANIARAHQPVIILSDEHRINNHTTIVTSIGLVKGMKSSTALDWYKAPDPRPDYYRYLPSYQPDSALRVMLKDAIEADPSLLQINWDRLYEINRNSLETTPDADGIPGNAYTGLRAHYLLEARVVDLQRIELNRVYNTRLNEWLGFSGGCSFQSQQSRYYKKIHDLLGSDYTMDWNQFAERDFPDNMTAIQNDLNHPNRVLHEGDVYGYDYMIRTSKAAGWVQLVATKKRFDFFAAAEFSYTNYQRDGKMRNGLFPGNSYGRSIPVEFGNLAAKAGIVYKINGRKYFYFNALQMSRPPLFDNVFISPRTRDTKQETIQCESITSAESGFICNAPAVKMRATCYVTSFAKGMNVMTFYHDGYGNFVNYALSGIDKIHYGIEFGLEWKLAKRFTLNAAASAGRFYYNSRPMVSVTADNDAYVLERTVIYQKNYRVGGTPQEAYGLGIGYQSANGAWYLNVSGNYFREQWLDINPLRRTYEALEDVAEGSDQWNRIIAQEKLPEQYTIDFSGGGSVRTKLFGSAKRKTIVLNLSISNLMNKKNMFSGGYEQLRFDVETKNTGKFPPKYFYAMGLNFSLNCSLRL
ncbi:TonB-dependent receptor [Sediminibacterium roseum]|uniref:TonB-dependent receptor n=1 Tax=Sediminibacterium roseum TaxID=1978412 RepID=A0ABW9ZYA0_9BACT|nr:TonB-dependent receptor [Sediminibacterium roseum]NCI51277.1 TonB-dependent receptor [Sediminibacterium roseum]